MLDEQDISAAAARLRGYLTPTPVLQNAWLNDQAKRVVLLKAENLNCTGSFKIRGALNRLLNIPLSQRHKGVVAMSSGNHAQAVAQAASWLGMTATIVMPDDAPIVKRQNTLRLGATVVGYDRAHEDRQAIAADIAASSGATLVHPYDDVLVMAGQGTCGQELAAYAQQHQLELGCVAAPCSGGGLIAGVGTAVAARFADVKLYAVEPVGYNDHQLSLQQQQPVALRELPPTLCDALQAPVPGHHTFAVNKQLLAGAIAVSDADVLSAMKVAALKLKLTLEPAGAAALAALLNGSLPASPGAVGLVLSGGNVDAAVLSRALAEEPTET